MALYKSGRILQFSSLPPFSFSPFLLLQLLLIPCLLSLRTDGVGETSSTGTDSSSSSSIDALDNGKTMVIEGDIKLGVIVSIREHRAGPERERCGSRLRDTGAVQMVEGVVYALNRINARPDLLTGHRLGAVVVDDCAIPVTSLARAVQFLPIGGQEWCHHQPNCSRGGEGGYDQSKPILTFHEVVGVIGAEGSSSSIMVANLLSIFNVPQISPLATGDVLSDKKKFPYFMRMLPPNRHQVKAMAHLFVQFNWKYISAVYSKGGYGESGIDQLNEVAVRSGLCVGVTLPISRSYTEQSTNQLLEKLLEVKAVVVVLLTDQEETRLLLDAIKRNGLVGKFVLVGGDGVGINLDDFDGLEDVAVGILTLKPYTEEPMNFYEYFESLNPCGSNATQNPWFYQMWSELFSQPIDSACDEKRRIVDALDYTRESTVSLIIDSVQVFAHAIDRLIRDRCPLLKVTDVGSVRRCLQGPTVLDYMRQTTFQGESGAVRFDDNGDTIGRYEISNLQRRAGGGYSPVRVAIWDIQSQKFSELNDTLIKWNFLPTQTWHGSHAPSGGGGGARIPVSRCGETCQQDEVYSFFKDTCCWECRKCELNERPNVNGTKCVDCPPLTWPEYQENFTGCKKLEPEITSWTSPVMILLTILSILGIVFCFFGLTIFILHNEDRLIKSSSRELSYLMWSGILIQYFLVFVVVARPNTVVCYAKYIGFNVSSAIVYSGLLTKTNRIYRLFREGSKGRSPPILTSSLSQIVIALVLIVLQIIINVIVVVVSPPKVELSMPVRTQPQVELACAVSIHGFMTSLFYDVMLVVVCSYYAFKTRMLPDNYNESRYISFCVYTTLVIWLAFVPSYFTTTRPSYQAIVLSFALILNSSVAVVCLFAPKIFAVCRGASSGSFNQPVPSRGRGRGFVVDGGQLPVDSREQPNDVTECYATTTTTAATREQADASVSFMANTCGL